MLKRALIRDTAGSSAHGKKRPIWTRASCFYRNTVTRINSFGVCNAETEWGKSSCKAERLEAKKIYRVFKEIPPKAREQMAEILPEEARVLRK